MVPIKNIELYNQRMKQSLIDKIFFIDKVPSNFALLDYGCGDGSLIQFLTSIFPENIYIGYDFNDKMIKSAKLEDVENIYTTNYNVALKPIKSLPTKTKILNLSSVIHELYSYCDWQEVSHVWNDIVFSGDFTHIVIRDMMPSRTINRDSYANDVCKVIKNANLELLDSFENRWGTIQNFKNLVHFLLKYKYIENWEREVNENYFPISIEDLYRLIPTNYDIIYQEHYCLPFLHERIKQDFNIDLDEPTHIKLILRRK